MLILFVRTDKPLAELYLYKATEQKAPKQIASNKWQAHRQLSATILQNINALLAEHELSLLDLDSVVLYRGPGSFTGLRIGAAVVNALGAGLQIPVFGVDGRAWRTQGLKMAKSNSRVGFISSVSPLYGAEAFITQAKK